MSHFSVLYKRIINNEISENILILDEDRNINNKFEIGVKKLLVE